jgi:hypothetical protein
MLLCWKQWALTIESLSLVLTYRLFLHDFLTGFIRFCGQSFFTSDRETKLTKARLTGLLSLRPFRESLMAAVPHGKIFWMHLTNTALMGTIMLEIL